jgi:hypothetical protein
VFEAPEGDRLNIIFDLPNAACVLTPAQIACPADMPMVDPSNLVSYYQNMDKFCYLPHLTSPKVVELVAMSFTGIAACRPIKGGRKKPPAPRPAMAVYIISSALRRGSRNA